MNASASTESSARRRWLLWAPALALMLLSGAWAAVKFSSTGKRAEVAAGYVAHVVCSCRYVGNRDLASCKTDLEPGMEIVSLEDNVDKRRVTAWVPTLAKRSASYDPEYGCLLKAP